MLNKSIKKKSLVYMKKSQVIMCTCKQSHHDQIWLSLSSELKKALGKKHHLTVCKLLLCN